LRQQATSPPAGNLAAMSPAGWAREFDAPIETDGGRQLTTLRDAGHYVTALSKAEQKKPHWQTAARELLMAAERGGILMPAEIAMRQALAHGKPTPPSPPRRAARPNLRTSENDGHPPPMPRHWIACSLFWRRGTVKRRN
jgi:hypothetical protein